MCNSFTHPCLFFVCTGSERGSVCKITLQSPGLFNTYFTNLTYHKAGNKINGEERFKSYFSVNVNKKLAFGFNIDFLYSLCQINKEKEWL